MYVRREKALFTSDDGLRHGVSRSVGIVLRLLFYVHYLVMRLVEIFFEKPGIRDFVFPSCYFLDIFFLARAALQPLF